MTDHYGPDSIAWRQVEAAQRRAKRLNMRAALTATRNLANHQAGCPTAYLPDPPHSMTRSQGCSTDVLVPWQTPGETAFDHAARQRWELERRADEILAAGTCDDWHPPMAWHPWPRLDVVDRWTRQLTVAPDRVAFRGTVRYRRPAPMRYSKGVTRWLAGSPDRVAAWARGDADLADELILGAPVPFTAVTLLRTHLTSDGTGWQGCNGRGWIGSRHMTARAVRKVSRAAVKRARAAATPHAKGRTPRSPWTTSASNVRSRWSKATDGQRLNADALEVLLRTTAAETPVDYVGHMVTVDQAKSTVTVVDGTTYGIRDYSRRAALAGLTPT